MAEEVASAPETSVDWSVGRPSFTDFVEKNMENKEKELQASKIMEAANFNYKVSNIEQELSAVVVVPGETSSEIDAEVRGWTDKEA